ncbi:response regulator receiver [Pseudopedobacter saltans DSM 12145]|uniref:Response regulator receiver n=1 Tax=Pseudopedobacter saltans (strain ATCC 51119 / DSM 12145 / JCM 21818 / CCUG 39354 / LMG 10337 / NBRC 100064 / NCIMB 13643) TaxID=762903 RepID=F0S4S1_PSESL|nr:response regulator [Pseudopedobacter saltans]ADY53089.1 response regulator receiver [Pseudopedobacter saltans DSM 12145]
MSSYKYKNVLLVDDNHIDNAINEKVISSTFFAEKVYIQQSCEDAIKFLKQLSANPEQLPQVIFVDIKMPVKTGFDFLVEFQQLPFYHKNEVKIVMLSSSLDPTDHKKIDEFNNVSDFYGKPLTADTLKGI